MATVSEKIAQDIIKGDGYHEGDPRVYAVLTYMSPEGEKNWAITYNLMDLDRYFTSPWVKEPTIIWKAQKRG